MEERFDVERIAKLARIELTESEKKKFQKELEEVSRAFELIDEIDPKCDPAFRPIEVENVFREDEVRQSLTQAEALANTKLKERGFFKGPRLV